MPLNYSKPTDTNILTHEKRWYGNDILASLVSSYPRTQSYQLSQHTISIVLNAVNRSNVQISCPSNWELPSGIDSAIAVFVGYLLLDAWIGNGDRHHENWGFTIQLPVGTMHIAPTYDHASCLGRELLDIKRQERLKQDTVGQYAERSRSAFYKQEGDKKPMLTFDVFATVAQQYPNPAKIWIDRLSRVSSEAVLNLFQQIPPSRISEPAIEFAIQLLEINQARLLGLSEAIS